MLFRSLKQTFLKYSLVLLCLACQKEDNNTNTKQWVRDVQNPILRDFHTTENYQSASDGHVFYHNNLLYMIYSGDANGVSSIKLARGNTINDWEVVGSLLSEPNSTQTDINKETSFYRKANSGKHQIYYIGYEDGNTYQSQLFLAEANAIEGPYTQLPNPIVARGIIANKNVYLITSPSVVEHNGILYLMFIGWNNAPEQVTEVWIFGATSTDDGHTWSNFEIINTPIGMEGQVTKTPEGNFVAVRTADYNGEEALFYATSNHPYGPWTTSETPILTKDNSNLEEDEIIAPQITFDNQTGEEYLFYTGSKHEEGWWMLLAKKE